jgi:hypothetical protein
LIRTPFDADSPGQLSSCFCGVDVSSVTVTLNDPQFFAPTGTVTVVPSELTSQVIGQPELLVTVHSAPGHGGVIAPPQTVPGFTVSGPTISISSQQASHLILNDLQELQLPSMEETHTTTVAPSLFLGAL